MSTLTKAQWQELEERLSHAYGVAHLMVDGYKLSLQVAKVKELRYEIIWYVNGQFKGIWLTKDCEEVRRFARPCSISLYSTQKKSDLVKKIGVRGIKKYFPRIDEKRTYLVWSWPSFKPFKRHLLANNKSIELLP